jgi:hypothetical protein
MAFLRVIWQKSSQKRVLSIRRKSWKKEVSIWIVATSIKRFHHKGMGLNNSKPREISSLFR